MTTFPACVCRWLLTTLVVYGTLQKCESFSFIRRPLRTVRAVEGFNNSNIALIWEFTATASKYSVIISRQRPGETEEEQIASRSESSAFSYVKASYSRDYSVYLPATLRLIEVKIGEEYVYTLSILDESGVLQLNGSVTVEVVVPPKITIWPEREPQLKIGYNYTMLCNASGDPHPNITWTKDGVPVNQFNVSGYLLHLINVQRKDAGSYRCTASNGYGMDDTTVSIVGIRCPGHSHCTSKEVGIAIRSEDWKDAFANQASVEYKTLESKLLSAIWIVFTKTPVNLYRVNVNNFRAGSVYATVELLFEESANDPLRPLRDEMQDEKLGPFIVDRVLDLEPTIPPTFTTSVQFTPTASTTVDTQGPPDTSVHGSSGLTSSEIGGIIGGCIALVLLIVIIGVVLFCHIYKKGENSGGPFLVSWSQVKHRQFKD